MTRRVLRNYEGGGGAKMVLDSVCFGSSRHFDRDFNSSQLVRNSRLYEIWFDFTLPVSRLLYDLAYSTERGREK